MVARRTVRLVVYGIARRTFSFQQYNQHRKRDRRSHERGSKPNRNHQGDRRQRAHQHSQLNDHRCCAQLHIELHDFGECFRTYDLGCDNQSFRPCERQHHLRRERELQLYWLAGRYLYSYSLSGWIHVQPSSPTSRNFGQHHDAELHRNVHVGLLQHHWNADAYTEAPAAGRTYIRVYNSCTSGCSPAAETSLVSAPTSGGTSYTVRGLQGNGQQYVVVAEVDTLNNGQPNASNPWGSSSTVTINSSNVVANVTLTDPATPTPPTLSGLTAPAGNTFVLLQYNQNNGSVLQDNNGREIATSYKVYYDTNSGFTNGTFKTFPAHGTSDKLYVLGNLTTGTTYYFKISALVGATEGTASNTVSATPAAGTGSTTVTGTVTFPGAATGPLYVGVYNGTSIYGQQINSPSSGLIYSYSGVPSGNYQAFAIIDQDNNGLIDSGDISNVYGSNQNGPPPLTVSGTTTTNNIALTSAVSTVSVATNHQQTNGADDTYSLNMNLTRGEPNAPSL